MKKKIALHGSYYMDNFGDTLFVVYFYKWLKENINIKDEDIVLPFANERVRKLVDVSKKKGLKSLINSEKVVFIGGGYLGERPHKRFRWNIRLFIRHLSIGLIAVILKKPFIFIGVGAGPLSNPFSRAITIFLCNKSEKVIVRDQESYDYLLRYGAKKEKLHATADSILLLQKNDVDEYWDKKYKKLLPAKSSSKVTYIGLHLQVGRNEQDKLKEILQDIKEYSKKLSNFKIVIFNDTYKEEFDSSALNQVKKFFHKDLIVNIEYENPDQLIAMINNLDIVITTKLHCGIVANCLGKYTLSVSVHNKTTRLYKQLDISERQIFIDDYESGYIEKMLADYESDISVNNVPEKVRELANQNKKELLNFVE